MDTRKSSAGAHKDLKAEGAAGRSNPADCEACYCLNGSGEILRCMMGIVFGKGGRPCVVGLAAKGEKGIAKETW